jgi:PAS domain S-box-containing protein
MSGEISEEFFERLKQVFEALPIGAGLALDPAGENIILNGAARVVLDVSRDQNVSISMPATERPAAFRHFVEGREIQANGAPLQRAVLENRPIGPVDVTIERWNGDLIHSRIIAAPIHDVGGSVAGGLALMLNVEMPATAELRDEVKAIAGTFEYFDSIIAEALPHIVWVTDAAGTVTYFNRRWQDYTGQTRADALTPNGWLRAVHPDDRLRVATEFATAVARGTTYETEYRFLSAAGSPRSFLARGLPMRDLNGEVISLGRLLTLNGQLRHPQTLLGRRGRRNPREPGR